MPKYLVTVTRVEQQQGQIEVEALNAKDARTVALLAVDKIDHWEPCELNTVRHRTSKTQTVER